MKAQRHLRLLAALVAVAALAPLPAHARQVSEQGDAAPGCADYRDTPHDLNGNAGTIPADQATVAYDGSTVTLVLHLSSSWCSDMLGYAGYVSRTASGVRVLMDGPTLDAGTRTQLTWTKTGFTENPLLGEDGKVWVSASSVKLNTGRVVDEWPGGPETPDTSICVKDPLRVDGTGCPSPSRIQN